ncbi:MAG: LysR family transcriptional regulator [Lachnospiraceae bacterium]|nr:LysR family transcriptional regulator [Lachnospiraceae bacterium]
MLEYKDYVYAVYQERSFSRAAQKLYISQPWLSSVVKKVEQEVKAPLFDRSTNPISLTEAGRYYIEQVEKVTAIEEDMRRYFAELHAKEGKELHIGSSMFFCTYVLPRLMDEFRALYPDITLTFSEGSTKSMVDKMLHGKVDFLLEAERIQDSQIESMAWASEEIVLAVPARFAINRELAEYCYSFDSLLKRNEPGRKKPAVPLQRFQDEPFLMLKQGNDIYERSAALCRKAGFEPRITMYLTQMMTAYYLTCEGSGVSFLRSTIPEYVTPTDSVVFYQLDDPLAIREIYLSYPRKKADAVQRKLVDFMGSKALGEEI